MLLRASSRARASLLSRLEDLGQAAFVHERILEQAELRFHAQDALDGRVHKVDADLTRIERGAQRIAVAVAGRQLDVNPGVEGKAGSLGGGGRHPVIGVDHRDGFVIGHEQPIETQLAAQQIGQDAA